MRVCQVYVISYQTGEINHFPVVIGTPQKVVINERHGLLEGLKRKYHGLSSARFPDGRTTMNDTLFLRLNISRRIQLDGIGQERYQLYNTVPCFYEAKTVAGVKSMKRKVVENVSARTNAL